MVGTSGTASPGVDGRPDLHEGRASDAARAVRTTPGCAPSQAAADAPGQPVRGLSRRAFLRRAGLAGGTALVVSAGGLSYRAYDQGVLETGERGAYDARGVSGRMGAARWRWCRPRSWRPTRTTAKAWVFRTTPSRVDVLADRKRPTATLDPFDREM
jgi:hypothetical protein